MVHRALSLQIVRFSTMPSFLTLNTNKASMIVVLVYTLNEHKIYIHATQLDGHNSIVHQYEQIHRILLTKCFKIVEVHLYTRNKWYE